MEFRYRYVDYGTAFVRAEAGGDRPDGLKPHELKPHELNENELVVDVGGRCWGYAGYPLPVLDHHFVRDKGGQFPAAAAAVLHRAADVHNTFHDRPVVWLVTHQQPDFDAFAAMFLARQVLLGKVPAAGWEDLGVHPDGWFPGRLEVGGREVREFNWFAPPKRLDDDRRAAVLLAATAAAVDNCKRLGCPRDRTLHSVVYAAAVRGRRLEPDGAEKLLTAAWAAIEAGANPLTDAVPLGDEFVPELALLSRQGELYDRDLRRARKAVVFVPQAKPVVDFHDWYGRVAGPDAPPLDPDAAAPTEPPLHDTPPRGPVDGVCIRDPECLVFKEWVRQDLANSTTGAGFLFTAVAYSAGRPNNRLNQTDYYFSLDPERSGRADLYPIWQALQAAEVRVLDRRGGEVEYRSHPDGRPWVRSGYESRAGGSTSGRSTTRGTTGRTTSAPSS
ncbi:MAG: hypothetical protein K2X87_12540 [Gemmataceae bacterium]|nr:hypothetical protein [Gemmataceae bacterium]